MTSRQPVDGHDRHATIRNRLGIDHTKLTFKYQGRHIRLTDVHRELMNEVRA